MRELAVGFVAGWIVSRLFYRWQHWHQVHSRARLWEQQQRLYRWEEGRGDKPRVI